MGERTVYDFILPGRYRRTAGIIVNRSVRVRDIEPSAPRAVITTPYFPGVKRRWPIVPPKRMRFTPACP